MFAHRLDENSELRLLTQHDAEELFALIQENEDRLRMWVPWLDQTSSLNRTVQYIRSHLERLVNDNGFSAGIWHHGRLSGEIRYEYIDWANYTTEIGYWIGAHAEGNGIISRATRWFVDNALETLDLYRVQIRCASENVKSRSIAERLGFAEEGVLRQSEWLGGRRVDLVVYSMLRDEWVGIRKI